MPWHGFLWASDSGGVVGTLTDAFGMVTEIVGVPELRDGVIGYALTARLVAVPDCLALPGDVELGIAVGKRNE